MVYLYLLLAALAVLFLATRLAPGLLTRIGMGAERRFGGLSTRTARVGKFDMPYLEGGKGEALMLIHGFAGDKDNFTRIARFLTPHHRVLIPDLPGFGEATRDIDANYFMSDQVGRLHAFLTQLGVKRVQMYGLDDQLSWVLIPLLGFTLAATALTAIYYGLMSAEKWNARFNPTTPDAAAGQTHWLTIGAVVFSLLFGAVALMSSIVFSFQRYFEFQLK